jgi:hypothetical protein
VHRFLIRGLNEHMASVHGEGIDFTNFLYYYIQSVLVMHICGCVCFLQLYLLVLG